MIPDQYPNYYKALDIHTGYFDSLDIMILFSYPSSIVIMRDYYIDVIIIDKSSFKSAVKVTAKLFWPRDHCFKHV